MVSLSDKGGPRRPALMAEDPLILGRRDPVGLYLGWFPAGVCGCEAFMPPGSAFGDLGPDSSGPASMMPGGP